MGLIDRIIIKEWFKAFIGSFIILLLITTVADLVNGFIRGKDDTYILTYYMIKMPSIITKMLPASCLLATLFCFNNLKNNSELIAIFASGFSVTKMIQLVTSLTLVAALIQFLLVNNIEPSSNRLKIRYEDELSTSKSKIKSASIEGGKVWYRSQSYFASFSGFDAEKKALKEISLYFFSPTYQNSKIIHAKEAKYVNENQWLLKQGLSLNKLEGEVFSEPSKFSEMPITLHEAPEDFKKFESEVKTLSLYSLNAYIKRLEQTGINVSEYKVIFYDKIALIFTCYVFALFSISTIYTPNRRTGSFAKNVIYTLSFSFAYWVAHTSTLALGTSGKMPPFLAANLVPFFCGGYIYFDYYRHQKV
ncbi:MAG: LptF/LptG family permease [Bacteriovoracaceae bacterium]|nr:LptF/LptG family permease [Bacteriovoracaceae bacterium]